jgi:pimeloyl-ACP methyl ester carboxylesterase
MIKRIAFTACGPIEYRIVGWGPAVLALNGGHTNAASPLGYERFFVEQGYQLIIPSRPGYGKTPSSAGKSAEAFANALVGLLDYLETERVIVLGISAAGPTALQFAGGHPERVSCLILQNAVTGARFPEPVPRLGAYVIFNRWTERWTWAAFRAFARVAPERALITMMGSLSSLDPAQVVARMSQAQQRDALTFLLASRSGSGFLYDIRHHCGDLGRITAPTLIIASQFDGAVDLMHARYAAEHIANAELLVCPAESHLLWFSACTTDVEAKMRAFLQAHASST